MVLIFLLLLVFCPSLCLARNEFIACGNGYVPSMGPDYLRDRWVKSFENVSMPDFFPPPQKVRWGSNDCSSNGRASIKDFYDEQEVGKCYAVHNWTYKMDCAENVAYKDDADRLQDYYLSVRSQLDYYYDQGVGHGALIKPTEDSHSATETTVAGVLGSLVNAVNQTVLETISTKVARVRDNKMPESWSQYRPLTGLEPACSTIGYWDKAGGTAVWMPDGMANVVEVETSATELHLRPRDRSYPVWMTLSCTVSGAHVLSTSGFDISIKMPEKMSQRMACGLSITQYRMRHGIYKFVNKGIPVYRWQNLMRIVQSPMYYLMVGRQGLDDLAGTFFCMNNWLFRADSSRFNLTRRLECLGEHFGNVTLERQLNGTGVIDYSLYSVCWD